MDKKAFSTLKLYLTDLKRKPHPFLCPHCQVSILPKDFEKHCSNLHGIKSLYSCVWCLGSKTWGRGKKNENALHLLQCFRKFYCRDLNTEQVDEPPPPLKDFSFDNVKNPRFLNTEPLCAPMTFFGHQHFRHLLPSRAFKQFRILNDDSLVRYFSDPNLNSAASYVRKFVEMKDRTDWYHVMVKTVSFESFLNAIDEDRGKVFILPFSCWCDGGVHKEAWFRQHRHMIIVSEKDHFSGNVWPKVKPAPQHPTPRNFVSKRMKKIESPMHLVNTLGYLSKRASRCGFSIDNKKGPLKNKHFYIFKTLPKEYRLPLAVQWEDGLMEQMYLEFFQSVSTIELANSPLIFQNGKYKQKIKDFYKFQRGGIGGFVLSISKEFIPTLEATPDFAHLLNGRKLHFKISGDHLNDDDDESRLRIQVRGGNCFYENVREEMWEPRPRDQSILLNTRPVLETNWKLESENRDFKGQITTLKRKYEAEIENFKNENMSLKRQYEDEIESLKNENANLKRKYEEDIDNLKKKNESLKRKCFQKERENNELRAKINELQDYKIKKLEEEIQRLQQENQQLRDENQQLRQQLQEQVPGLQQENKQLRDENQKLRQHNEQLLNKLEKYENQM